MRILHIEDNLADAFLLQEVLKASSKVSFDFTHAARFADGVHSLEGAAFDLVLLDHNLPDVEGWGGLERLRAEHPTLPIVVLSGNDDPRALREAISRGAQDYWLKGGTIEGDALAEAAERAVLREAYWARRAGGV